LADYARQVEEFKLRKETAKDKAKKLLRSGAADLSDLYVEEPTAPPAKRYIANDCTYEALGAILVENSNGVLAFRDELVSLLKTLDREDNAAARGFYLSAWNGTGGYTFDRIVRGKQRIEAACVSMLGSTQPGRIGDYLARAVKGGSADDGLVQRFGLLVWPDQPGEWRESDRYPDSEARQAAYAVFERLDALDPMAIRAERDPFEAIPFLRFEPAGLEAFVGWRTALEMRFMRGDLHPALESHLSKYRKLVPTLALICHLADGHQGPVGEHATAQALGWADYLESHARRAYGAVVQADMVTAKLILKHARQGDLEPAFTARDIYRRMWTGLTDRESVQAGLDLLADHDWLMTETVVTGGRPREIYRLNPRATP